MSSLLRSTIATVAVLSTLSFYACEWLPHGQVLCTANGDNACPEGWYCNPNPDADGNHFCDWDEPGGYTPPDSDDDDSPGDDDDTTPPPGDDDDAVPDDDDTGDDDTGDDDDHSDSGEYLWHIMEPPEEVAGQALYGVSFPSDQTACASSAESADNCIAYIVGSASGSATRGTILKTDNGGHSWQNVGPSNWLNTLHGVHFLNPATGWAVGASGTVFKTGDGGVNWNQYQVGNGQMTLLAVTAKTNNDVFVVDNNGDMWSSENGGESWNEVAPGTNGSVSGPLLAITTAEGENSPLWAVGNDSVLVTYNMNGDKEGYDRSPLCDEGADCPDLHDVQLISGANGLLLGWAVGSSATVMARQPITDQWLTATLASGNNPPTLRAVDFTDGDNGWIVGNGMQLWRTSDGAQNWTHEGDTEQHSFNLEQIGLAKGWPELHDVDFTHPLRGLAVGNNGTILVAAPDDDDDTTTDTESECDNGEDDDKDGWIDCDDTDCHDDDACPTGDDDDTTTCDQDLDGFMSTDSSCAGQDCNDADPAITPLAWDGPAAGVDSNCDNAAGKVLAEQAAIGIVNDCVHPEFDFMVGPGGDFTNDGRADIALGNPGWISGGGCGTNNIMGQAYVMTDLTGYDLYTAPAEVRSDTDTFSYQALAWNNEKALGRVVALDGDYNNDGISDLLIGAPHVTFDSDSNGAVFIVPGGPIGSPPAVCNMSSNNAPSSNNSPCNSITILGNTTNGQLGASVAWLGDLNNDGFDELGIGEPGYNSGEGRIVVLDGQGLSQAHQVAANFCDINGITLEPCFSLNALNASSINYFEIKSVTAVHAGIGEIAPQTADLNLDGYLELAVPVPTLNKVYILAGSRLIDSTGSTVQITNGHIVAAQEVGVGLIGTAGSELGTSITFVADVDGDGKPELAVGAPAQVGGGVVYLVTGQKLLAAFADANTNQSLQQLLMEGSGSGDEDLWFLSDASNQDAMLGQAMASADLTQDGQGDLVLCAPQAGPHNSGFNTGPGQALIFLGGNILSALQAGSTAGITPSSANFVFEGDHATNGSRGGDMFCSSVALPGNVDGDSQLRTDVVVGASDWGPSGNQGKAYLFPNHLFISSSAP